MYMYNSEQEKLANEPPLQPPDLVVRVHGEVLHATFSRRFFVDAS